MKSIRDIVLALSKDHIRGVRKSFYRENDKVAQLFELLLNNASDETIKNELKLGANAYTTLRSRLRTKVQNYLVRQSDSPRADVLNKLLSIEDIIFTEQPVVALATLKKLERELTKYDLSNELTIVYKYLKKLHLNTNEYFHYSKLYNRHVAYSLALDKAEDLLAKYFIEYGLYYVMGDTAKKLALTALFEEMKNVCALYRSHRMFVYLAALQVFHCLYVDEEAYDKYRLEPVEDVLAGVEDIFKRYPKDGVYKHLHLLFKYIRFAYYHKHGITRKAQVLLDEINSRIPEFLIHYENYGFPAQVLIAKLQRKHFDYTFGLSAREDRLFGGFQVTNCSQPAKVVYFIYRALACYHIGEYAEAAKWLFRLTNEVGFKERHHLQLEVKCLTAFMKYLQQDKVLFRQNLTSAQRVLRIIGAENAPHLQVFVKLLSILNSDNQADKPQKIGVQIEKLQQFQPLRFQPVLYLQLDQRFVQEIA